MHGYASNAKGVRQKERTNFERLKYPKLPSGLRPASRSTSINALARTWGYSSRLQPHLSKKQKSASLRMLSSSPEANQQLEVSSHLVPTELGD